MSYGSWHSINDCDKCGENIGKKNLFKLPFLYLDRNDQSHKNLGNDYRQYYVCKSCLKKTRMNDKK